MKNDDLPLLIFPFPLYSPDTAIFISFGCFTALVAAISKSLVFNTGPHWNHLGWLKQVPNMWASPSKILLYLVVMMSIFCLG